MFTIYAKAPEDSRFFCISPEGEYKVKHFYAVLFQEQSRAAEAAQSLSSKNAASIPELIKKLDLQFYYSGSEVYAYN